MIPPTLMHYGFAFCMSHVHGNRIRDGSPGKKLEIRLAELCVDLLQQNNENYAVDDQIEESVERRSPIIIRLEAVRQDSPPSEINEDDGLGEHNPPDEEVLDEATDVVMINFEDELGSSDEEEESIEDSDSEAFAWLNTRKSSGRC
ncbi:uncharacterized protein [Parasteatoda tepidariorum]|uniref:uncharacterized protein n=1 Tax=Parasteatoda tepidariorum TaxID=114398 RepID=UPI000A2BFCC4